MFWCKTHNIENQIILAICDKELLGKNIGNYVKISKEFFCDKEVDENEALKLMSESNICNMFGKRITDLAEKKSLIDRKNIILVGEIPHAQFIRQ